MNDVLFDNIDPNCYYSISDLEQIMGDSLLVVRRTLTMHVQKGNMPAFKQGGLWKVKGQDYIDFFFRFKDSETGLLSIPGEGRKT